MRDFLARTLNGRAPQAQCGEQRGFSWQWREEGILSIAPDAEPVGDLVISAAIHGNETAPVELLDAIIQALAAGELPLRWRLLVLLGNPGALRAGRRYQAQDLNRLFSQGWQRFPEGAERERARLLEQRLMEFYRAPRRWHLDLHTALRESLHPRFGVLPASQTPWDEGFLAWLGAAGLEALVFHQSPAGTFSHFSHACCAALSATLELGKARPLGDNDLTQFRLADMALRALLRGETPVMPERPPRRYRVVRQLTKQSEAFVLHMADQTPNFTAFHAGDLLAEESGRRYLARYPTEYVLFPNPRVAPGLRAGLMLIDAE
ncbi:succinylglutamate desuccinylase [Jejubacter calystegiae]|uniref:Succinylglutamate desuccinylase n=1 Tax=Jejubacter calystegiae TaxID=2579935 RepID=A0A4P8YJV0_9ENTR|nr:succinylglutamate desuccinylase [Jejubacter calystegiae]QCT21041.1 succinylglutamate desuccinylase [Jejubacter calystegiae]